MHLQDVAGDLVSPGKITTAELLPSRGAELIERQVSGQAELILPLSTSVFPEMATLSIQWPAVLDPTAFTFNDVEIAKFLRFNSITTADVLAGLAQLPAAFEHLRGPELFGSSLALIGGNLAGLIHLDSQFAPTSRAYCRNK